MIVYTSNNPTTSIILEFIKKTCIRTTNLDVSPPKLALIPTIVNLCTTYSYIIAMNMHIEYVTRIRLIMKENILLGIS